MSNYAFNYSFNISGNCNAAIKEIADGVGRLHKGLADATSMWDSFEGKILALNQFTQYIDGVGQSVQGIMRPGAALNASLADLSAISGVAGDGLKIIERNARDTARMFGGSAAQAVESYKLLLSQLSPELAKYPEAMQEMGIHIARLSKTMGGDATAAATVLTTAMNQYGISLADPMEASRQMAEMMNIMAAAGREGSAELPTIQEALRQCGMMAKAAGVSFAETNASIQVLDKAGKKGAEGGVALRNVMSVLSQGRFLPKDVKEELQAAGVDINTLTDKSKSLTERLRPLQGVMQDSALFTKLFGRENSAAAMALVQGIDQVETWTQAITGTNTAVEQSEIIMETYNERLARVQARFDDIKISVFNACGDFGIWTSLVAQALVPVAQLTPLVLGLGKALMFIKNVNWAGVWATITGGIVKAYTSLAMYNGYLSLGRVATLGFRGSVLQAAVALARFATVGLANAIKGIGAFIASLVTGGTAAATFAGVASASFAAFKTAAVAACRAVGVAIMNIPIIGWIAAAIAVVIAVVQKLWDKCYGFRVAVFTAWEGFKAIFSGVWELIKSIAQGIANFAMSIWNTITGVVNRIASAVMSVYNKVKGFVMSIIDTVANGVRAAIGFIKKICQPVVDAFNWVVRTVGGFFSNLWAGIKNIFIDSINWLIDQVNKIIKYLPGVDYIKKLGRAAADASWAADHPSGDNSSNTPPIDDSPVAANDDNNESPIGSAIGNIGGQADKTDRIKNITVSIDRLVENLTIQTTNLHESKERIKDIVTETLVSAVNDVNYAI